MWCLCSRSWAKSVWAVIVESDSKLSGVILFEVDKECELQGLSVMRAPIVGVA